MSQTYPDIAAGDYVSNGPALIKQRDDAIKSNFSGTAFPTTDLQLGMACFRSDLGKLYVLTTVSPAAWTEWTALLTAATGAAAGLMAAADKAKMDNSLRQLLAKPTETTIASNVTLASDAVLQFAMAANTKYLVRARVQLQAPAACGYKIGLTGPATPAYVSGMAMGTIDGSSSISVVNLASLAQIGATTPATVSQVEWALNVLVANGANAGTFAVQLAQNVSSATALTVRAGSALEYITVP